MSTKVKKHKLGTTKPASQLFLFSNKLNKNINSYFSGNVVIEIELKGYDYKYHDEAKQVVDLVYAHFESRVIKPYKFLTVVLNYKPSGLTLTTLSGEYDCQIAVHGSVGYKELHTIHSAYVALLFALDTFDEYSNLCIEYTDIAKNEPLNLSERKVISINNQLEKTKKSMLKDLDNILSIFQKKFQLS